TLSRVVPALYRDLDAAVRESYPDDDVVVPPLLTFGSWMGGDRDGNPNVTPDLTAIALGQMKEACLTHLERVIGELAGRVTLSEDERMAVLEREIADRRPLIPGDISGFSASTRETVETFRTMRELLDGAHAGALGAYIISNTCGPSDLLEILLLMKEVGLARAGGSGAVLRIVPLFESGDTLAAAAATMRTLLKTPVYRAAVDAVGEQEIMVGYSDSNKDVGYVASGWGIYRAQIEVASVMREHGV